METMDRRTRTPNPERHGASLTMMAIAAIVSTIALLFAFAASVRTPRAEGATLVLESEEGVSRTVVAAPEVTVPLLTKPEDRSMVGAGHWLPNGMPDLGGSGFFSTYDLLVPGRAVVENEYKLAIPHLVELRLSNPSAMPHETPILGVIWDADGDGNADHLGIAFYAEGALTHWKTFRIVGEALGMREIDFRMFLELYPDNLPET